MTLTPVQWIMIAISALGFIGGATAQLTDMFGPMVAKDIASAAGFLSGLLSTVVIPMTGQAAQVKSVLAMPGVESVKVNAQANQTLATLAVDPAQDKIEPVPNVAAQVSAIAKGA